MKLTITLTGVDKKSAKVLDFDTQTCKTRIYYDKLAAYGTKGEFLGMLARMFLWAKDTIVDDTIKRETAEGNRTKENAEALKEVGAETETGKEKTDPTEGHSVDADFVR